MTDFFFHLLIQAIKLQGSEGSDIADAFKNKDHFSAFKNSGVLVEGVNYQFMREDRDGNVVLAKKKHYGTITLETSPRGNVSTEHCLEVNLGTAEDERNCSSSFQCSQLFLLTHHCRIPWLDCN